MNRYLIAIALALLCICPAVLGQDEDKTDVNILNTVGLGFQLNRYHNDFGMGLHITSPYFGNGNAAVRLRGNLMFLQHAENAATTWTPYGNLTLGFIGTGGTIGDFLRLYGEGGIVLLLPNNNFSTESVEIGGYGLFGFEFNFGGGSSYFIELGGMGTGATADLVAELPIYSNGFMIDVGFRKQF